MKQLDKLDKQVSRAIVRFMAERVHDTENQRGRGNPLRAVGLWRYRVGDYRVLCSVDDHVLTVLVVELGHRRDVYR